MGGSFAINWRIDWPAILFTMFCGLLILSGVSQARF